VIWNGNTHRTVYGVQWIIRKKKCKKTKNKKKREHTCLFYKLVTSLTVKMGRSSIF